MKNATIVILGIVITAFLALGSHDLAIAHLGIPYPDESNVPLWAKYIGQIVRIVAMVYTCHLARWYFDQRSTLAAATIFGLLIVLLQETLRVIVVDNIVSEGRVDLRWVYLLMTRLPNALLAFYSGAVAVFISRRMKTYGPSRSFITIATAAAIGLFIVLPTLKFFAETVTAGLHLVATPEVYKMPYGFHVYKYIYGMFIEPTVAAFILAYLVCPRLSGSKPHRIFLFAILLLLMRGRVVATGLFSIWVEGTWIMAVAAEGQFLIETLILALLAASIWAMVTPSIPEKTTEN